MELTLRIFVTQDCPTCAESHIIAHRIRQNYPDLSVEVIDVMSQQDVVPEAIFATPTFMLNNRVVSLGNPKLNEVARWVKEAAGRPV